VRQSQARRWVVYEALRNGDYYPWDYQPLQKASERYMRNHMDLNVLEENQKSEREDRGHSFGGVDTPEYLAMNPNGLVPVLIDGGAPIFESMAIIRYLADTYRKEESFWPTDPANRAQIDKWAEWGKNTWGSAISQAVFWPLVRTSPQDRNLEQIAKGIAQMNQIGQILDDRLASVPFVAGQDFTLADI